MQRPIIRLPSLQCFKYYWSLVATFAIYFCCLLLLSLSSLSYHSCHLYFVASKYISGAVELTTQLSKLINTLWLPLCRINKLGYLTREDYLDPLQLRVIYNQHNPPQVGDYVDQAWGRSASVVGFAGYV